MISQIYVNLPVKNLEKTKDFFSKLGFTFNPAFTDKNAACMIIGENIYAMLIVEEFFKTFTKKKISNAKRSTEVLLALSAQDRKKVDELLDKAIAYGGREAREPQDYGWMYGRSFEDVDGHIWEIIYMDESKRVQEKEQ